MRCLNHRSKKFSKHQQDKYQNRKEQEGERKKNTEEKRNYTLDVLYSKFRKQKTKKHLKEIGEWRIEKQFTEEQG